MYKIPSQSNAIKEDHIHFAKMNERFKHKKKESLICDHPLTKICHKYKEFTDKGPTATYWRKHCYTEFYGPLFNHLRNEPLNILEIGIRWGGSLLMWRDFFPNASIYGVDTQPHTIHPSLKSQMKTVKVLKGNAYSKNFINTHFKDMKFDIILDDGSHKKNDQIQFFNLYQHYLKKDGYLICEDYVTVTQAKAVIEGFNGKLNKMSLINRTHCIPSGKGEIIIMYKE